MKRTLLSITAATALAAVAVPALAQGWQSINQRQANLDRRIDQGVRGGQLTRAEAAGLRAEFVRIAAMEARYRAGGLQSWEQADLDRRFDQLSLRIRDDRNDRDTRWMPIDQRQANLDRRIDQGVRSGQLTRSEAARLRNEFRDISRMEIRYRRDGLQNWERADLDRRFDRLSYQIRDERRDRDNRYTYNYR